MSESCFTSEIYALYVIGSLDGDDLSEFDRHLAHGCEVCRGELTQARELWCSFAAATPALTPRPELKQKILAAARPSNPLTMPSRRVAALPWWQQAAAAILFLGVGIATGWNLRRPAPVPGPVAEVAQPTPTPAPAPTSAPTPSIQSAEQENRALRGRIEELQKTLATQQAQLRETSARVQSEISRGSQGLQQAQSRITQLETRNQQLQGETTSAEARAREAEQRFSTADHERKLALDRESRQRETTAARIRQLEGENEKFRRVIDDQQRRIQQNTQLVAFFQSPDLKFYRYTGTGNGPGARAHVVMQSGSKAVLYAFHLPQLPAGRTYQLWLIRGQSPAIVSGGIFQADAQGNAVVQFSDAGMLKDVRQFAVTDEPNGGSPGPTGKQFLRAAS